MIRPSRTHSQYLEFFQTSRDQLDLKIPDAETHLWCKFRRLNLFASHPILARLYHPDQGRPARPPEDILRSWLLMLECDVTSVEVWVQRLRANPLYALLSGFAPDDVPGVGTFYDFQDRVLHLYDPVLNLECRPRRRSEQRKKDASLRDKNNLAPHVGILDQLADRLMARPVSAVVYGQWHINLAAVPPYQRVLKEVFYTVVVSGSVARGLIDLNDLHVAGDGTHLRIWANAHGHKLCTCNNRDKPHAEHCDCLRRFHDPLASWGWDSYHECYVYGHAVYTGRKSNECIERAHSPQPMLVGS
jgi:hypothetical protein